MVPAFHHLPGRDSPSGPPAQLSSDLERTTRWLCQGVSGCVRATVGGAWPQPGPRAPSAPRRFFQSQPPSGGPPTPALLTPQTPGSQETRSLRVREASRSSSASFRPVGFRGREGSRLPSHPGKAGQPPAPPAPCSPHACLLSRPASRSVSPCVCLCLCSLPAPRPHRTQHPASHPGHPPGHVGWSVWSALPLPRLHLAPRCSDQPSGFLSSPAVPAHLPWGPDATACRALPSVRPRVHRSPWAGLPARWPSSLF